MLNPHAPVFSPSSPSSPSKPRKTQAYTGSFLKPLRPSKGSKQYREMAANGRLLSEHDNYVGRSNSFNGPLRSHAHSVGGVLTGNYATNSNGTGNGVYHAATAPQSHRGTGAPTHSQQGFAGTLHHSHSLPNVGYQQHPAGDVSALSQSFHDMSVGGGQTQTQGGQTSNAAGMVSSVAHTTVPHALNAPQPAVNPYAGAPHVSQSHPTSPRSQPYRARTHSVGLSLSGSQTPQPHGRVVTHSNQHGPSVTSTSGPTNAQTRPPFSPRSARPQGPQQEVCKFFLMGECKIINCQFLHSTDSQSAVCRYWQWGNCRRGDQCRFLHRNVDDKADAPRAAPDDDDGDDLFHQIAAASMTGGALENGSSTSQQNEAFDFYKAFPPFEAANGPASISMPPPGLSGAKSPNENSAATSNAININSATTAAFHGGSLAALSLDLLPSSLTRSRSSPAGVQMNAKVAMSPQKLSLSSGSSPAKSALSNSAPSFPSAHPNNPNMGSLFLTTSSEANTTTTPPFPPFASVAAAGLNLANANTAPGSTLSQNSAASISLPPAVPGPQQAPLIGFDSPTAFPPIGSPQATAEFVARQTQQNQQAAATPQQQTGSGDFMNLAAKFKLEDLQQRHFPHVAPHIVEAEFKANKCTFRNTAAALSRRYGAIPASMKGSVKPGPKLPAPIPHPSLKYEKQDPHVKKNSWVATGDEVGLLYEQYRAEAVEHALQRNALFQRASEAFCRGDGKLAKEFSERGKMHDEQMKEGHKNAARVIFDARNKRNVANADGHLVIDMHGLHRQEATELLRERLAELAQADHVRTVDLLLGTGHHSTNGKSILLPAVLEFLQSQKYVHREVAHGGRGGAVRVMMHERLNNGTSARSPALAQHHS